MKKSFIASLVCVAMAASLGACGLKTPEAPAATTAAPAAPAATTAAPAAAPAETKAAENAAASDLGAPVTLVYAEVNPLDTIVGSMDQAFKDKVEELSGGNITIDLQASGVLGSENDVLDGMLAGASAADMSRISAFALTSYGGAKSMLLSLPYTFVSRDHFWNFATSDLAKEFLQESSENGSGVKGLFYGEEGFRHFFANKEMKTIDDLKGMKIRVSNDPVMNGMVEGLGASPTVVAFNELYSALQTGVVDAAEQPIANYKSNAFPEVANNIILDGHTLGAVQVVITDAAWNKLTPAQQAIMEEAGAYASNYCREMSQSKEDAVLAELKAGGCNVVEVSDAAPWQSAVASVVDANVTTDELKALYKQILEMK